MIGNILFAKDNDDVMRICVAWKVTEDAKAIARMLKRDPEAVADDVRWMRELGILQNGKVVDADVDRYIQTYIAGHIRSLPGSRAGGIGGGP